MLRGPALIALLVAEPSCRLLQELELDLADSLPGLDAALAELVRAPATLRRLVVRSNMELAFSAFTKLAPVHTLELEGFFIEPDEESEFRRQLDVQELVCHATATSTAAHLAQLQLPALERLTFHGLIGPRGLRALLDRRRTPKLRELVMSGADAVWMNALRAEGAFERLERVEPERAPPPEQQARDVQLDHQNRWFVIIDRNDLPAELYERFAAQCGTTAKLKQLYVASRELVGASAPLTAIELRNPQPERLEASLDDRRRRAALPARRAESGQRRTATGSRYQRDRATAESTAPVCLLRIRETPLRIWSPVRGRRVRCVPQPEPSARDLSRVREH